ncbi:MAG: pseudouridine synthase [Acholeplasmataceae bacterium]
MERLQKVLANANIASRRKSEEMILEGRVSVNGEIIKTLGYKVSKNDNIVVDGQSINQAQKVYYLMNKPTGCLSTAKDDKGRKTVIDFLDQEDKDKRVYPVGRLDFDSAGLILLTNDGDLTYRLTHPKYEVEKEYLVRVKGIVIRKEVVQLRKGLKIDQVLLKPKYVHLLELDKVNQSSLLAIVLTEGRNREIRRLFEALNHEVKNLTRVRYDFLTIDGVERGSYRELKIHEIKQLYGHAQIKS